MTRSAMMEAMNKETHLMRWRKDGPRFILWEWGKDEKEDGRSSFLQSRVLTVQRALEVIDQIGAFENPVILFTGENPLSQPNFFDLAMSGKKQGIEMIVEVSPGFLTPKITKKIRGAGINRVAIRIEASSEKNDGGSNHFSNSYASTFQDVGYARKQGLETEIHMDVTGDEKELDDVLSMAEKENVDTVRFIFPVNMEKESRFHTPGHYDQLLHWIYDKSQEVSFDLQVNCGPQYNRIMLQGTKGIGGEKKGSGCQAGIDVLFLSKHGKVYPCPYLPVEAGDVEEQSLEEIWIESSVFKELRNREALQGNCTVCEFVTICSGCRARAFSETGCYMGADPFCTYTPRLSFN